MVYYILFIIIILFYILHQEHFDARISSTPNSIQKCGKFCTETYGCSGFAYDTDTNRCYIGNQRISPYTPPLKDRLYSDEYNQDTQYICNKLVPIMPENLSFNKEIYINNMIYRCSDNKLVAISGNIIEINSDNIDLVEPDYTMSDIRYPSLSEKRDFII